MGSWDQKVSLCSYVICSVNSEEKMGICGYHIGIFGKIPVERYIIKIIHINIYSMANALTP